MPWLLLLILIGVVVLIIWLSGRSSRKNNSRIPGQICPKCGSEDVRWAGYSDRKECAKCGKIFG